MGVGIRSDRCVPCKNAPTYLLSKLCPFDFLFKTSVVLALTRYLDETLQKCVFKKVLNEEPLAGSK